MVPTVSLSLSQNSQAAAFSPHPPAPPPCKTGAQILQMDHPDHLAVSFCCSLSSLMAGFEMHSYAALLQCPLHVIMLVCLQESQLLQQRHKIFPNNSPLLPPSLLQVQRIL